MEDDMLADIVKAYAAAKIQRLHILNQNGANMVYNHGRDIANKLGLGNPPQGEANQNLGITPFPNPSSQNNVSVSDSSTARRSSPLATAALVVSSLLGGAGLATILPLYFQKPASTAPTEPNFGAVDIDVR
jgi:hypothetical protein